MSDFALFDTTPFAAPPFEENARPSGSVASVASVAICQEGVRSLAEMPRPEAVSETRWRRLIQDAQSFERIWLDRAVARGWTIPEMFGCYCNPLASRLDHQGLVHGLHGRPVLDIDADIAIISADETGGIWMFRRSFDRSAAVPIWDAYRGLK